MEEKIKKLLEQSKFVQELPDNEKKLVMQNAQDIASDLLETEMEDLDAFVKEKYPDARILQGEVYLDNMKLGKVTDLYAFDAVNNYLEGVENERFLKSSGIENDPNITGSNVLDAEDFDEDAFQNYRNKIESLEDLPEAKYKEIVTNLSGDEIANLSEQDIAKIYDEVGLKYDSEYGGVRELDTSAKPKSSKLLSALKWLDPVEEAIAGMVTKIGLPSVAQAYVVAEAVNWFGNLTLEAARSKGELDLLNSKILTGQATDDEIKDFGKNIMSNLKQGVKRAEKVSPSANVMNWIGKMLDR
jgi:hypothetical protein